MFDATIDQLAVSGADKAAHAAANPFSFLLGAAMAGAYVGFGAILMYTVGAHTDIAWSHLVMGAVFAAGLTIITFAGGHLFTGCTMLMALAWLRGRSNATAVARVLAMSWFGNLIGAVVLAALFKLSGGGSLLADGAPLFFETAAAKANTPGVALLFRAILCNWLVCLTVWMCARTSSDGARLGLIFWPVMVFAACGFEHSVANMFTFGLALLGEHPASITLGAVLGNLASVTAGNAIGGMLMVGCGYWAQSSLAHPAPHDAPVDAPVALRER